jgi:electron transfer flavoprotein alpha subunit
VLLLPQGGTLAGSIVVLLEASPGAELALRMAARLGTAAAREVVVLAVAATRPDAEARAQQAGERLAEQGLSVRRRAFAPAQSSRLSQALREEGHGLLIVADDSPLVRDAGLRAFLDAIGRPLLIAR